jgi:hypothetical protein
LRGNLVRARVGVLVFLLALGPSSASADWLFAPFFGGAFGGSTALLGLERGADTTQFIFGGSVGWWSAGIIGFESDFAYAPRFFETDNQAGLITGSNVLTWSGNVVVAAPVSVTRESLRPYVIGGLGWMRSSIDEGGLNLFPELVGTRNSTGINFGGGAVGFITSRTALRFEIRHFRSLERSENPVTLENESLLSFWRLTVGVVIRR